MRTVLRNIPAHKNIYLYWHSVQKYLKIFVFALSQKKKAAMLKLMSGEHATYFPRLFRNWPQ